MCLFKQVAEQKATSFPQNSYLHITATGWHCQKGLTNIYVKVKGIAIYMV